MSPADRDVFTDHWLYRCFDASGRLLYIGITTTAVKRFRVHGNRADWWPKVANITIEHHDTEEAVRTAEVAAIRRERPIHNCDFNGERSNVLRLSCQCRFCRVFYRPTFDYKLKACCPDCRDAGHTRKEAS